MTALLVAAAVIAGAGAIAGLAAADVRLGLIGLTASLVGAALLADPLPTPAVLGVRLTAALLAVVTLRAATPAAAARHDGERGWSGRVPGPRIGWPVELLLGAGGGAAGLAIASGLTTFAKVGDVGQQPATIATTILGPTSLALAIAGLILATALGPMLMDRPGPRRAVAAVLLSQAAILVHEGLAPTPGVLDEVVLGALIVTVAAAGAMLTAATMEVDRLAGLAGTGTHLARPSEPHLRRP